MCLLTNHLKIYFHWQITKFANWIQLIWSGNMMEMWKFLSRISCGRNCTFWNHGTYIIIQKVFKNKQKLGQISFWFSLFMIPSPKNYNFFFPISGPITIEVHSSDTILRVKAKIWYKKGFLLNVQRLYLKGISKLHTIFLV